MRPIERGSTPTDKTTGKPKNFSKYEDARGELIARLGEYCSYCEMHLDTSLAVEHILPKSKNQGLTLNWSNFLLSCTNCNSTKGNKTINLSDYYWPDRHNTFCAFEYRKGGIVRVNGNLSNSQQQLATNTMKLTGFNKTPGNKPAVSDRRWLNRREAWDNAELALKRLKKCNTDFMREQIVETAKAKGFWSVWMTVFKNDPDMLSLFIEAFPGTCRSCFDSNGKPFPRPGGSL